MTVTCTVNVRLLQIKIGRKQTSLSDRLSNWVECYSTVELAQDAHDLAYLHCRIVIVILTANQIATL